MARLQTNQTEQSNRRYIAATMKAPLLERDHEADLARRWRDDRDEQALHEIIEAHGRLVVKMASKFRTSGLPLADLIQEGNIGLMEAADRFDPDRDVRFSTYASWWIMASIQNYILRNSSIVRAATTPKQRRLFFNLRRLRAKIAENPGGMLTTAERQIIADELEVSVSDVERMEGHLSGPDPSLNATMGDEEDANQWQDRLIDERPTPEEFASHSSTAAARTRWVHDALGDLNDRERDIIASRFLGEQKSTLAEIGARFGVSKERVRQIENRALQKMQASLTRRRIVLTDAYEG